MIRDFKDLSGAQHAEVLDRYTMTNIGRMNERRLRGMAASPGLFGYDVSDAAALELKRRKALDS